MKKIAILFWIGAFFICTAYSEEKKNFIKVDKNVEIDEQVYKFFYDFFSDNRKVYRSMLQLIQPYLKKPISTYSLIQNL